MAWPPTLAELKDDLGKDVDDTRDDDRLTLVLDAAVEFVAWARCDSYNFDGVLDSDLPDPSRAIHLGTLRLAGRWHTRRRSPDGLINMKEFGQANVPSFDIDIDRLLGLGRFAKPLVA
jgi:hypothetical protein